MAEEEEGSWEGLAVPRQVVNTALIIVGVPVGAAFAASAISFTKEKTLWSFLQLLGAIFLIVVVFTHLAEAFRLLPWMGWGLPNSVGHYIDLISAAAGLTLFPAGYLSRRLAKRKTFRPITSFQS